MSHVYMYMKVKNFGSLHRLMRKEDRRDEERAGFVEIENYRASKEDIGQEETESFARNEKRRTRKGSSSCSSYYSVSSTGEAESDTEIDFKHVGFVGESLNESEGVSTRNNYIGYDGKGTEKLETNRDSRHEQAVVSKKENAAKVYKESSAVDFEWRKKSEKKLNEESTIEQSDYRGELAETGLRSSEFKRTGNIKSSNIRQLYQDRQEKTSLSMDVNLGTRLAASQKDNTGGESDSQIRYKQFTEMPQISSSVVESSSSQKIYNDIEEKSIASVSVVQETIGKHSPAAGHISRQDGFRRKLHPSADMSENQEIYDRGSLSVSESRMKNLEDNSTVDLYQLDNTREKHQKAGRSGTSETAISVNVQFTEISETEDIDGANASLTRRKSDDTMTRQDCRSGTSEIPLTVSLQLAELSEAEDIDAANASVIRRKSDITMKKQENNRGTILLESEVADGEGVQQARASTEEIHQSSAAKPVEETVEGRGVTSRGVLQMESRKGVRRPTKASSFNQGISREATSPYTALKLIPESSELVPSGRLQVEQSGKFSSEKAETSITEVHLQTQENSQIIQSEVYGTNRSSFTHEEPTHDDVLGSADRQQKSSMHFIGEFFEKAMHEISENTSLSSRKSDMKKKKQDNAFGAAPPEANPTDNATVQRAKANTEERHSISEVKSSEEKNSSTYKRALHIGLVDTRRPTKASSFNQGMPKEAISSYKALKLIPENIKFGSVGMQSQSLETSQSQRSGTILSDGSSSHVQDNISHEHAVSSSDQVEKSSSQLIGGTVENVKREDSTSEVLKEKKIQETKLFHEGEKRRSRGQSRDEMWHEADESIHESLETDAPEMTVSLDGNGVVKRNGRSLWSMIGDILKMRWPSSHTETHASKSGQKSSPNQSNSSDAWFSGYEANESGNENTNFDRDGTSQEAPAVEKQQSISSPLSLKDKLDSAGKGSLSLSSSDSDSASKGISFSIEGTSGNTVAETSFRLPAIRMRRSLAIKDVSADGQTDSLSTGKKVELEQLVPLRSSELSVTEAKDDELKRRKLQRKDRVLKDSFDEWEEAHNRETEQRRIDEMFMREALLEARKGADLWEVPVGAVLVHDGKIIARGYNLVEDLRDSTAHAEMICIREASNILRTWRLSETTLYVTLEPCPMCAGAILQARIDCVVWGAPNKLLGADGSWIRLFPDGAGGTGTELTDKPAAPVHPFHPNIVIRRGVLSSECADVMQQFFQLRRKKKDKKTEPESPTPPACLPITHHHPSRFLSKMQNAFHIIFCL